MAVYNRQVRNLGDLRDFESEVMALRRLFEGEDDDLGDLAMVQRQLALLDVHYRQLDSDMLSGAEFEALLKRCIEETEAEFGDDAPPLDTDMLYSGIAATIKARRRQQADAWISANVPDASSLQNMSADEALKIRRALLATPRLLNDQQALLVRKAIKACDRRLDALEVEGLVARYERLAEESKRAFLERIGVLVGS